jgi:2-dehydropantoate 2-reductase
MKAGIIGAGALGSLFAAFFSKSGIDYSIFEIDKDTAHAVKNGLTLISGDSCETFFPEIDTSPEILCGCDIIFLFVKSYSTGEAAASVRDYLKKDAIIVSLQNGIGNFETIAQYINEERILYGITTIGASKDNASAVRFGGTGIIEFGGSSKEALVRLSSMLHHAGLDIRVTETPAKSVWQKAIINAGVNPIAAILSITNGEILNNEFSMKLQEMIIREGTAAAQAAGIILDAEDMIERTIEVCRKTSSNRCSMLQDIANKRRTEIDYINGKIIDILRNSGIAAPYNESVYSLVKALELKIPASL